jgi:hypothetical protein
MKVSKTLFDRGSLHETTRGRIEWFIDLEGKGQDLFGFVYSNRSIHGQDFG